MAESRMRRLLDRGHEKATLISDGCKITGTMTGKGSFFIGGHFDGDCDIDGSITISENGLWTGSIKARNVIIAGTVEGDIHADGKVEINDTARIGGAVTGEAIAVAEGAIVQGSMNTTGQSQPVTFKEKREPGD
jgi:cytoskeletal protein CcmA (bactofilin family)